MSKLDNSCLEFIEDTIPLIWNENLSKNQISVTRIPLFRWIYRHVKQLEQIETIEPGEITLR